MPGVCKTVSPCTSAFPSNLKIYGAPKPYGCRDGEMWMERMRRNYKFPMTVNLLSGHLNCGAKTQPNRMKRGTVVTGNP